MLIFVLSKIVENIARRSFILKCLHLDSKKEKPDNKHAK